MNRRTINRKALIWCVLVVVLAATGVLLFCQWHVVRDLVLLRRVLEPDYELYQGDPTVLLRVYHVDRWAEVDNLRHGSEIIYFAGSGLKHCEREFEYGKQCGVETRWDHHGRIEYQERYERGVRTDERYAPPWWGDVAAQRPTMCRRCLTGAHDACERSIQVPLGQFPCQCADRGHRQ